VRGGQCINKPFKFLAPWLYHLDFNHHVSNYLYNSDNWLENINNTSTN